jgi:hypothetical protein
MNQDVSSFSPRRLVVLGLLSWLLFLGVDFFLHGGLLANLYVQPSPSLLPLSEAFKWIPLVYLSGLLLCVLLLCVMLRLGLAGWRQGLSCGLLLGALIGGTALLGLLSISTAELSLLVGWFFSQTVGMGLAGAVAGSGLAGQRLRTLFLRVVALVSVLVVATIAMQSMGLAPVAQLGA